MCRCVGYPLEYGHLRRATSLKKTDFLPQQLPTIGAPQLATGLPECVTLDLDWLHLVVGLMYANTNALSS